MTATIGELCMGYGGLGMGLSAALGGDTRVAWAVEYDKHPSAIIAHRYPGVPNYGDVKTADWSAMEPVDWLTAGYPCQPFSLAGLRKGADDPRHLWPGVARAISVLRPGNVLLENVAAHLRDGFDTVLADLAAMGYDASWGVVRASDAGAPHGRARVFVVAHATGDARRLGHGDDVRAGHGTIGRGPAAGRGAAEDPDGAARGERRVAAPGQAEGGRSWADAGRRGGAPVADADHADGWSGNTIGRPLGRDAAASGGEGGQQWGAVAAADPDCDGRSWLEGLPVRRAAVHRDGGRDADGRSDVIQWGAYAAAVARWQGVTGRPAPRPTQPGRSGERLSPRFVEWMMGLPDGWVTAVPGLPRNAQLKALGNGVVPQQAALACWMLGVSPVAVAA